MTILERPFVTRSCGHRVPSGVPSCPFCHPPRLSVEPLADLLRRRSERVGMRNLSVELSMRLGMDFKSVERQIRRIVSREVQRIEFHTAESFCVALGGDMPPTLWGQEWENATPIEPYGDEGYEW